MKQIFQRTPTWTSDNTILNFLLECDAFEEIEKNLIKQN